jgi:GTP-binding protein EngB required for normal cell division
MTETTIDPSNPSFPVKSFNCADAPLSPQNPSNQLASLLEALQGILKRIDLPTSGMNSQLEELNSRWKEERFHLAVLGQFKRGKSTLLNALLGEHLLPTGIIPLTAIPTLLRYGSQCRAWVYFHTGKVEEVPPSSLSDYVSETSNPKNVRGVQHVEAEHPSPLLKQGVILIDTPGIGSTFTHNTEATLAFLPQCDAALFLISADPPITEVEVEFLRAVQPKVAHIFYLLNKVDYLSAPEMEEAVEFFHRVLREKTGIDGQIPIFGVSAKLALEGKISGNEKQWETSGMKAVESHLFDFLAKDKTATLCRALAQKAGNLCQEAVLLVNLEKRSLEMPLEELESKRAAFQEEARRAEYDRQASSDLLAGDHSRALNFLENEIVAIRRRAKRLLAETVTKTLAELPLRLSQKECGKKIWDTLEATITEIYEGERVKLTEKIQQHMDRVLSLHLARINDLVGKIRQLAAQLFDIPFTALTIDEPLERVREPYWVTYRWSTAGGAIPEALWLWILPRSMKRRRMEKKLLVEIHSLVLHNAENLRWALLQNLNQTFLQFTSRLDKRFMETVDAIHQAIEVAHKRRLTKTASVKPMLRALEIRKESLEKIDKKLKEISEIKRTDTS